MPEDTEKFSRFEQFINISLKTTGTSFLISCANQPLQLINSNIMKTGNPLHDIPFRKGVIAVGARFFYGFSSNAVSGQLRGGSSVVARLVQSDEAEGRHNQFFSIGPAFTFFKEHYKSVITVGFSQADMLIGQTANKGWLEAVHKTKLAYSLTNMRQLMMVGYPIRSIRSMITFSALCSGTDNIAEKINIEDRVTRKVIGSIIAGSSSAVVNTPLGMLFDSAVLGSTIHNGTVKRMTTKGLACTLYSSARQMGTISAMKEVVKRAVMVTPMNMLRTGITFGAIELGNQLIPADIATRVSQNLFFNQVSGDRRDNTSESSFSDDKPSAHEAM